MANNSTVQGPNPQDLSVKAGETAALSYVVDCVASGSLRITTVTTGYDIDSDGYELRAPAGTITALDTVRGLATVIEASLPIDGMTL